MGNAGRCVVTGSPRFDAFLDIPPPPARAPYRVLVATARTPYFHDADRAQLLGLLRGLRDWATAQQAVEFHWRLTGGLHEEVGLPPVPQTPLADDLAQCHALFTSPSSLQLEGMLARRPVVLLDPFHRPLYVPAAWYLRDASGVGAVMESIQAIDTPRMRYQEATLADQLRCDSPAVPRVIALAEAMIANRAVEFPAPAAADDATARLRAENERLREVANRRLPQVLYRALTSLERMLTK
jgi:hypothetical protein